MIHINNNAPLYCRLISTTTSLCVPPCQLTQSGITCGEIYLQGRSNSHILRRSGFIGTHETRVSQHQDRARYIQIPIDRTVTPRFPSLGLI